MNESEILQEDKNTLNCALLFNIVFTLCILLYRIGFGGNKLFVFVFVFVITLLRDPLQEIKFATFPQQNSKHT